MESEFLGAVAMEEAEAGGFYTAKSCCIPTVASRAGLDWTLANAANIGLDTKHLSLESTLTPIEDSEDENPSSRPECKCLDPNCRLRTYCRFQARILDAAASTPTSPAGESIMGNPRYPLGPKREARLMEENPRLAEAHARLAAEAGGVEVCRAVGECCRRLVRQQPQVLAAAPDGDTVLMQLCNRRPSTAAQSDAECARQRKLLSAQILAFARLYLESATPELLYARNGRGTTALELAALSDKAEAAVLLAELYVAAGRDPNEASGDGGHTVLHLLARKGDECARTLERLLALRRRDGQRVFRIDVVNRGRKTPLDVATACRSLFAAGPQRALYADVIAAFHRVVEEDARDLMVDSGEGGDAAQMTFRNF